jgi:hypothetical protein
MIRPEQKLQTQHVAPGSPEWFAMWRIIIAAERADYDLDLTVKPCPLCTPQGCWAYRGTLHRSSRSVTTEWRLRTPEEIQFCHVFRHNAHPVKGPMIRVVPCTKGWEPGTGGGQ